MLKAVRRIRSHNRAPEVDAVVGQLQIHATSERGQQQQVGKGGEDGGESEGAHGPTGPYDLRPVMPGSGVSEPALLHDAARPSKQSRQGKAQQLLGQEAPAPQNVGIPPVHFPGGRNPYLDRPLPPPPPPKTVPTTTTTATDAATGVVSVTVPVTVTRPIMPPRPSTSSGPDSSSSRTAGLKPNFDNRRLSKDDMALTMMSIGRTKKGLQPYRVGIKGGALPSPESSPDTMMAASPMPAASFAPARVMTPESLSSGEIQIGMALGSPSHASFQAAWQPQQYQPSPLQPEPQPQGVYSPPIQQQQWTLPEPEQPVRRQKTQKRRLFGLFGRKNVEPPKTVDVIEANSSAVSITSTSSPNWQIDSTPGRSNTVAGKKSNKHRPLIVRSGTENNMENAISPLLAQREPGLVSNTTGYAPQISSLAGSGLLDVEIPDIRLERYSIMFSGVLNQQGSAPASSLLARRQATLEKLKTINDKILDEEEERRRNKYRRATSPQPTKSPVFTLFPTTPVRSQAAATNLTVAPRASTSRMRSNTSPALLPSPSKAAFEAEQYLAPGPQQSSRKEKKTVTIVSPRTMDERNRAAQVEKLRDQQQQQVQAQPQPQPQSSTAFSGFRFGPEESALILDSPQSLSDSDEPNRITANDRNTVQSTILPLRPTIHEPQWEMISTPPSTSSESSITTKRTNLSSTSSASSLSSSAPDKSAATTTATAVATDNEDADAALKAAVEISIARQISISRQQRQLLLKPVQRSNTIASNNGNNGRQLAVNTTAAGTGRRGVTRSASSPNSAAFGNKTAAKVVGLPTGVRGRVAETKLATPRLVESGGWHQNRKSERVVLEGV